MSNAARDPELIEQDHSKAIAEELQIVCCLDAIGSEDFDCELVAMRAERAPGPAQTVRKVIELCHDQAETPVVISHQALSEQVPGDTRSSRSQRVMGAFRFLTPIGGVERRDDGKGGNIVYEIDLPSLAAGCRAAQLANQQAKAVKAAGGSAPRTKNQKMPPSLRRVDVDAQSIESFSALLSGNGADEDFSEAADALLIENIARTKSKVVTYAAAQRAIKAAINTPGYGRDNKTARRVTLLAEQMRSLTAQKGSAGQE